MSFHDVQQFYKSAYNLLDLAMTVFCVVTLLVVFFTPCNDQSREEEVLDTLLLVARNFFQFGRLAVLMRRSVAPVPSRSSLRAVTERHLRQIWHLNLPTTSAYRPLSSARGGARS